MNNKLYYNTAAPLLASTLHKLMDSKVFNAFRLVGGTALSLQRGHRISVDIDLFTDFPYGSVDFDILKTFFTANWSYVDTLDYTPIGMGKSYFIGESEDNCVKIDLYYTDVFIEPVLLIDGLRLASIEDIIAMKMDIISRGGRKKDFWDIHELMDEYSLSEMTELHKKRYPYSHDKTMLLSKITDFRQADDDFDPVCLRNKHWEIIKLDLIEWREGSSR